MRSADLSHLKAYLDTADIDRLLTFSKLLYFNENEEITFPEKPETGMYLILDGEVNLKVKLLKQADAVIETLKAGDYFGEVEYYHLSAWDTSYIAYTKTKCLFIPRNYLTLIENMYPVAKFNIDYEIATQMNNRIINIQERITATTGESSHTKGSFWGKQQTTDLAPEKLMTDEASFELIKHLPILDNLSSSQKNKLIETGTLELFPKYYQPMLLDDKAPRFYLVLKGAVQAHLVVNTAIAKFLILGPSNLFAKFQFLNNKMHAKINFITCERALLLSFTEKEASALRDDPLLWCRLFNLFLQAAVELKNALYKLYVRSHIEIHHHVGRV